MDQPVDAVVGPYPGPQRHLQSIQGQLDAAVRHPTMRRENTSETNAVNAIPDQVAT
jgi:hypothetical protein